MGAQKFMGAQKLLRGHDASASLRHPQMALGLYSKFGAIQPSNSLFSRTTRVSRYQKGKNSLDLNEAADDGVSGCSGISWTTCKQSAPRSRQITTPTPHTIFTGRMLFLTPQPTASKH